MLLLHCRGVRYDDDTYPVCWLIFPVVDMLVVAAKIQLVVCGIIFGG